MSKYFQVSNDRQFLSKEQIEQIEERAAAVKLNDWQQNFTNFQLELSKKKDDVVPANDRVIVMSNIHSKSTYRFSNGQEIALVRNVDNFNRRHTQPVNGIVLNSKTIPIGSEIIMHHNAVDPNNELFNYDKLGAESCNVKYLAVPEHDCYLYREPNSTEWLPCEGFATALKVYVPYEGFLVGIEPKLLKSRLLITSGKYKDKICLVAVGAAYEMIFQGLSGREERVIRLRTFEYENFERDEVIGIDHNATELYEQAKLLAGLNPTDAKTINE